jgi:DeoR family transcriptional regulator, suf operon transcriptional repressor
MAIALTNLFGATRGQIIALMRTAPRTVNDLADALDLTDNAVRTHLDALVSDGLVLACGTRPGSRKPHTVYELTNEARQMLSRLYIPVLTTLLAALKQHHPPEHVVKLVCEVGHRLAQAHHAALHQKSLKARIDYAVKLLGDMGGMAEAHKEKGKWIICIKGCPLAEAVVAHPHVCRLKETLLSDLLGQKVHEQCKKEQGQSPECCFTVGS